MVIVELVLTGMILIKKVWLRLDLVWVCDGLVTDLVQGVRGVGDQFPQEDFLIRIEGVDDQAHQLLDVRSEGKGLRHFAPLTREGGK